MGWTTVTCPAWVAQQFDCTPVTILEGDPTETLGYVNTNCVPVVHDTVTFNGYETYKDAIEATFMTETQGAAIGAITESVDVDATELTVVLAEDQ